MIVLSATVRRVKAYVLVLVVAVAMMTTAMMMAAPPAEAGVTHGAVRYSAYLSECVYGGWSWYDYYYNGYYYWYWC